MKGAIYCLAGVAVAAAVVTFWFAARPDKKFKGVEFPSKGATH